jgi:hypothetical protein
MPQSKRQFKPQPKHVLQRFKLVVPLQDERYAFVWSYACWAGSQNTFEEGLVKEIRKKSCNTGVRIAAGNL